MSGAGIRPQPPIAARDVPASSRWYQRLLVLLWLQAGDFDAAVARARALAAPILEGPNVNPAARHREIWLRDPDGYVVVLAGIPGDL